MRVKQTHTDGASVRTMTDAVATRPALVRRGLWLNYVTIGYNTLEAIVSLAGVALNTLLGWWWTDPISALAMVPIVVREWVEGLRGETACADCTTD